MEVIYPIEKRQHSWLIEQEDISLQEIKEKYLRKHVTDGEETIYVTGIGFKKHMVDLQFRKNNKI